MVLLIDPTDASSFLLRAPLVGAGAAVGRLAGGGLIGLGTACAILVLTRPPLPGGLVALAASVLHDLLAVALGTALFRRASRTPSRLERASRTGARLEPLLPAPRTVVTGAASAIDGVDARLRAELLGAIMVGLFVVRHVVRVEPLASVPPEKVATWLGPAVDAILGWR